MTHIPVLLQPAVDALNLSPGARVVDATYGRGGHSSLILEQIGERGELLVMDQDPEAVLHAQQRFSQDSRVTVLQANFADLERQMEQQMWSGSVDGLLLDIGVSSPQLDVASRGFSFSSDGDLDMRMDTTQGMTAAHWLRQVSEKELMTVIGTYGEERYARRIAKAIVLARTSEHIVTTGRLAEIVKAAHPRWERHHHPATRTFQAIRIALNGELDALRSVLNQAAAVLKMGGRLSVISFHSLEDRIVKHHLRKPSPNDDIPRHLPIQPKEIPHPWRVLGKIIKANEKELLANPRARSAVLRVAERIAMPDEVGSGQVGSGQVDSGKIDGVESDAGENDNAGAKR